MKITALETFLVAPRWLFLRVATDDGITGWGEPVVEGRAETVRALKPHLAPPRRLPELFHKLLTDRLNTFILVIEHNRTLWVSRDRLTEAVRSGNRTEMPAEERCATLR